MNYAKILAVYAIFSFSQPSLGMISPSNKTASETELFFPDTLTTKSEYLTNIQADTNPPIIEEENKKYLVLDKQSFPIEGTNQQLINELSDLYENTQLSSLSNNTQQDHNQLIILANLDHILVETSNPAKKLLKTLLADTIISCPIEQLSAFDTLNPDLTKKITLTIIKNNKLDTQLLEPYQKAFPKKTIKLLDPKNEDHDARLLFFNDEQMIYGIINKKSKLFYAGHYEQIVITDRNAQTIKTIPLAADSLIVPNKNILRRKQTVFVSPNRTYCLLQTCEQAQLKYYYTYKLINNITGNIKDLPHLANQAWCFASDTILCSTNEKTTTETHALNILDLSTEETKTENILVLPNNIIEHIECIIKNDNTIALIHYGYKQTSIGNNNQLKIVKKSNYYYLGETRRNWAHINHYNNKMYIMQNTSITQNGSITMYSKLSFSDTALKTKQFFIPSLIGSENSLIPSDSVDLLINSFENGCYNYGQIIKAPSDYWFEFTHESLIPSDSNGLLITSIINSGINYYNYRFLIEDTSNYWLSFDNKSLINMPDATTYNRFIKAATKGQNGLIHMIESANGKECIYTRSKIIFDDYNYPLYTLCDDNMLKSIHYLSTSTIDDIPPYTKLLTACLLDKIFKKVKSNWFTNWIQLDEAESRVYNQDCPQAIQAILKTLFIIQLSDQPQTPKPVSANTPQHDYFSSFTNYTNSMYKTLTDTISQYKTQLILGTATIKSTIGLTALYKYLMDKQSLPQQ